MASGSAIAAVNVPTPSRPEKSVTGKAAQCKTRQGSTAKNLPSLSLPSKKQTADQTFHDAPSKIIPDSQLQNDVANLERQVLEAKKAALQKKLQTLTAANSTPLAEKPAANLEEAKTSNFGLFYKYKGKESHLVPLMREYRLVDRVSEISRRISSNPRIS